MPPPAKATSPAAAQYRGPAINTVSDLAELASLMFKGGCQPPGIDRPEKLAVLIIAGLEVGLAPAQAAGSIMLTGGKPAIYGDGALALVRASGLLQEIDEQVVGEGEQRRGICRLTRKGEKERVFAFSTADATRAGLIQRANGKGPWATYPDRMLLMRARGFALRDVFPDVLRGLITAEEALDLVEERPTVGQPAAVAQVPPPPPPALPAAAPEPEPAPGPVTAGQLARLKELRNSLLVARNLTKPEEQAAAWAEALAPHAVKSAKDLTAAQAAALIGQLETVHDPFSRPSTGPGP